ncbi:MAG: hypothetical protein GXN93_04055 [Candidatus Diapherotrites archaeon]|nr:hypothetical protein [Candidatus Diapherotrites archaeon]
MPNSPCVQPTCGFFGTMVWSGRCS